MSRFVTLGKRKKLRRPGSSRVDRRSRATGSKICADNAGTMSFRLLSMVLFTALLAAGGAGNGLTAKPPVVSASSYGIAVVVPGQAGASAAAASAPGTAQTGAADSFAYPADGSTARTGALSSSVAAQTTGVAGGQAVTDVLFVTLFNGEITLDSAGGRRRPRLPARTPQAPASAISSSSASLPPLLRTSASSSATGASRSLSSKPSTSRPRRTPVTRAPR